MLGKKGYYYLSAKQALQEEVIKAHK